MPQLDLAAPDAPYWGETIALAQVPGPDSARLGGSTRKLLPFGSHMLVLTDGQVGAVTGGPGRRRLTSLVNSPSELYDMAVAPDFGRIYAPAGNDGLGILDTR